jgi:hypothetical protein
MNLISKLEREVQILQSQLKSARKFEFSMMRLMQGLAAADEGKVPFSTIGFLFELQTLAKRRDMKRYVQLKSSIQNAQYSSIVPIIDPVSILDDEIVEHSKLFLQSKEMDDIPFESYWSQMIRLNAAWMQRIKSAHQNCSCDICKDWKEPIQKLQSEELEDGSMKEIDQQQMKFVDAGSAEPENYAVNLGPSYDADTDETASLGQFLSRPVLINQYTWAENNATIPKTQFNPWALYFNDPIIRKKLDNYARLQCTLKCKFVLNASPFYYGALRAVYFPLADGRDIFNNANDQMMFSQPPGVMMNPATMTSVEMSLPFLWPGNWLRIPELDEFTNMGLLRYIQYAKLRSANGVSGAGITVSCYAWAEDVKLAGPTASLALQSDEYDEGPKVSGVATAVAGVASKLTNVPFIGDMARATEIGANVVGGVARLFGYSNPPVIEDVAGFHTKAFHAMANSDTSMPQDKLSLDPKNEITVDNSVTGISNDDPLAISDLATREAFLSGANYTGAMAAGTKLFTAQVTPYVFMRSAGTGQTIINHTPSGWVSRMFRQWRGSIVYKFVFVKSKYHTGRVSITWDPENLPDATSDTETTCFTRIVDLQYENEVEIVVPYKSKLPWLTTQYGTNPSFSVGAVPALSYFLNSFNGTIRMTVLNNLTGPATLPEIDILCFQRAGDDIMFSVPGDLDSKTSFFPLQSEEYEEKDVIGKQSLDVDTYVSSITVGESIASLRPLIHRTTHWQTQQLGYLTTTGIVSQTMLTRNVYRRVPGGPGFDPNGYQWANRVIGVGAAPYSYVHSTYINWIINAFAGYRGSINHTYNVDKAGYLTAPVQHLAAERYYGSDILRSNGQNRNRETLPYSDLVTSQQSQLSLNATGRFFPAGNQGMSLTNTYTQAALLVNCPQYSQWRFTPAYEPNRNRYPDGIETQQDNICLYSRSKITNLLASDGASAPIVDVYVSAGVDFSPVFFVCVPLVYEYTATPTANNNDVP